MKNVALSLTLILALATTAEATVQNHTTSGTAQTITLNASTTVLRFDVSSATSVVGITGGSDGRILYLWNVSSSIHVTVHHDHSSASSAADRLYMDANGAGGFRYLFGGGVHGMAVAVYDGTSQRWRFSTLESYNATGAMAVNGELNVAGNLNNTGVNSGGNTTLSGTPGTTRLTLKTNTTTNNVSPIVWKNSAGTALFSVSPDYAGDASNTLYLYDYVNGITNLYLNNSATGTGYLSFGSSYGGMQYAESTDELGLFANGTVRQRLNYSYLKTSVAPFYTRQASGTAKPTLETASCGASASQHADSSDMRGSVSLPASTSSCKMTFATPWDIETSPANGTPICTFTSSAGYITVSTITDHYVTFVPSSTSAQTVYYHCDGIIDPP